MLFSTDVVRYELSGPEGIEQAIRAPRSQRFRGGTDIAQLFSRRIEECGTRMVLMPMRVVISDFYRPARG
ncbi:hypothetical protein KCP75_20640 [Salmonella enterica subsp. enterica]|nr:hypothetical protein KCP75_20640 [Salmonella enterica subsp. enterica]